MQKNTYPHRRAARMLACLCAFVLLWMPVSRLSAEAMPPLLEAAPQPLPPPPDMPVLEAVPDADAPWQEEAPPANDPLPVPDLSEAADGIVPPIAGEDELIPAGDTGGPAELLLGDMAIPVARPGGAFDIGIAVSLLLDGQAYPSNLDALWQQPFAYSPQTPSGAYDQTIAALLDYVRVSLASMPEGSPLDVSGIASAPDIIRAGENLGYASFLGLRVPEGTQPGFYALPIVITWRATGADAAEQRLHATLYVEVDAGDAADSPWQPDGILSAGGPQTDTPTRNVPYGGDAVIVYDFAGLREALSGGQYATVYLGSDDINQGGIAYTDAGGIPIARSVTIDGTDPQNGRRATLTDWDGGEASAMYADTSGISITLRGVDITGRNGSGVLAGRGQAGVALRFENVRYTGRQLAHSIGDGATVTLADCEVSVTNALAETGGVTFEGGCTVTRTGAQTHPVIWLRGGGDHRVTIAGGASVTVDTTDHFLDDADGSPSLDVYGSLSVTARGGRGGMTRDGVTLGAASVHAGGTLCISHRSAAAATLRVGSLYVAGTLRMERTASATQPLIGLASGGSLTFDNPALVTLQNGGGALLRTLSGTASMRWTAQVVNRTASSTALAVWNNATMQPFTATFTATTGGATLTGVTGLQSDNRGAAIGASPLQGGAISFLSSTRLALGASPLRMNTAIAGQHTITGHTDAGAVLEIAEYDYYDDVDMLGMYVQGDRIVAGGDGRFTATLGEPIRALESRVYARSDNGTLVSYTYAQPLPDRPLELHVPDTLSFETLSLSSRGQFARRAGDGWHVAVYAAHSGFTLHAQALGPLTAPSGDTLPGSLLYVNGGIPIPLDAGDVQIHVSTAGENTYETRWAPDEGLLVWLPPFSGTPDAAYTATILWTLVEGP